MSKFKNIKLKWLIIKIKLLLKFNSFKFLVKQKIKYNKINKL
jgi:hypothetical protein